MTVYFHKARKRWMYSFVRNARRHSNNCLDENGTPVTSRAAARMAETMARKRLDMEPKLARGGDVTLGWVLDDLSARWELKPSWRNRRVHVVEILREFGPETAIADIGEADIHAYVTRSLAGGLRQWHGGPSRNPKDPAQARFWKVSAKKRGPATINLYLLVLRQALVHAHTMRDPLTNARVIEAVPKVPELPVPRRKARPMPDAAIERVMELLPAHQVEALVLTLFFGFRHGEVFSLTRAQIDWQARGVRLHAESVKNDEDAFLPASDAAMTYLGKLDAQAKERKTQRLITWQRRRKNPEEQAREPWRTIETRSSSAWDRAKKIIEAEFGQRWRWHDLRAAFITHVALTSGPVAAQALGRHSDYETTRRYVEVADETRRRAAERASDRPSLKAVNGGVK